MCRATWSAPRRRSSTGSAPRGCSTIWTRAATRWTSSWWSRAWSSRSSPSRRIHEMRIAIRGLVRDGNYVTMRLAFPEEGEKCFEFNTGSGLNLPVAVLGTNAEIVDEHANDDTGEWVIRFKLFRGSDEQ